MEGSRSFPGRSFPWPGRLRFSLFGFPLPSPTASLLSRLGGANLSLHAFALISFGPSSGVTFAFALSPISHLLPRCLILPDSVLAGVVAPVAPEADRISCAKGASSVASS